MLNGYIRDRAGWIGLYAGSLLLVDLLLFLDAGLALPMTSVLYLNGLLLVAFFLFFSWRYRKETAYVRALQELTRELEEDWLEKLPAAQSNGQTVISDLLRRLDRTYMEQAAGLQAAVRSRQNDTAAWVHEVKAPLTAMKLVIDANRTDDAMRKVEASWLRISLLVDQQLYLSRLPSLEADYVLEEADIKRLATDEIRHLMPWCLEHNIAIDLADEPGNTVTDAKWCRFIIRQLLTNAVKYSPPGGTIWITAVHDDAGRLSLHIKDEGPGIPAHEQPRIFDKGFTGSAGRIHNAATGLGLFLARQSAEKLGIQLRVQSDFGFGTEMIMTFPMENEFDATRK
ncbi:sensor protein BceS [Sporosarcina sp. NCCP-2716]|uniref:sensor histidine kinase n=1 Tax=Sporosarcina sp. NCCP-2716 TaxID=2943679 RepID=UPI00203DFD11|nr:sensor histidine kinase [Sporosarcina sp. NCCP-2716]GKV69684.1 sensor protein BceS [Sporosarcina sp. NCCP-2716]